jgi:hypothetical protein
MVLFEGYVWFWYLVLRWFERLVLLPYVHTERIERSSRDSSHINSHFALP